MFFLVKRRPQLAFCALASTLALVAAGCGSDSGSDTTAAETTTAAGTTTTVEWADGFCTAISTWTDDLTAATEQLKDPTSFSTDTFQQVATDVGDATKTFAESVKGLGRPDTEAGQAAQDELSTLADSLQQDVDNIDTAVSGASGIAGLAAAAATVTTTLADMGTAMSQTFSTLEGADAKGELKDAFAQAESCSDVVPTS